jgi:hypothetical protein
MEAAANNSGDSSIMDIYICSTVRHLLLSLCRASKEQRAEHHILFFADYQGASLDDWDLADLPKNIHVHEMSRRGFRQHIVSSAKGRLSYLLAMRTFTAPKWLQQPVIDALSETLPELAGRLSAGTDFRLWLFNERNKMSRAFRLLTHSFNIIEDGESNYLKYPVPWWKSPSRIMQGLPLNHRTFGDDSRCKEIWVIYPERLQALVKNKGRQINFLEGDDVVDIISRVMGKNSLPPITAQSVILATQPLDGMANIPVTDKQRIYETIATCLEDEGHELILKVHPAENTADYEFLQARTKPTPAKVPIEALVLSASEPPVVLSISSAAGLGFERFCRRIKLIEYDDKDSVRNWVKHPEELMACLKQGLKDN